MANNTAQPSGWTVTGQQQKTQLGQGGTFERGYDVSYQTTLGHTGSVFIKDTLYGNIDAVRALIQTAAENSDAVGTLTSG